VYKILVELKLAAWNDEKIQWNPDLRFSCIQCSFFEVPAKAPYTQCINYPILVFLDLGFFPHLVDENSAPT
jgi:hypothetical protein